MRSFKGRSCEILALVLGSMHGHTELRLVVVGESLLNDHFGEVDNIFTGVLSTCKDPDLF